MVLHDKNETEDCFFFLFSFIRRVENLELLLWNKEQAKAAEPKKKTEETRKFR